MGTTGLTKDATYFIYPVAAMCKIHHRQVPIGTTGLTEDATYSSVTQCCTYGVNLSTSKMPLTLLTVLQPMMFSSPTTQNRLE